MRRLWYFPNKIYSHLHCKDLVLKVKVKIIDSEVHEFNNLKYENIELVFVETVIRVGVKIL